MHYQLVIREIILPLIQPSAQLTVVLVSDTHTSSSSPYFHPALLPAIRKLSPDIIFHAGDISLPKSLAELQKIAPCYAVKGNRDITNFSNLPDAYLFQIGSRKVFLTHSHAPLYHYVFDKIQYMFIGYRFPRYYHYLENLAGSADIFLFGHTHIAINQYVLNMLFINPGAACSLNPHDPHPSFVVLRFREKEEVEVKFIYL
jgi:uncharacterized protein